MTISDSTLSGNSSTTSLDGTSAGSGGGIYNSGTLTVRNSTLSGNSAIGYHSGAGGISNSGTLTVSNTIIAGNLAGSAPDLSGNLGSEGHNLIGNTQGSSGFDSTDLLNVNPMLGPLQNNGGPTLTRALLAGSPALNAGDPAQLGVPDQRGVVRRGGVNIGAYQASANGFVVTAPTAATAGTAFDVTVKAVDTFGQTAVGYRGTAHFGSSDSQAVKPGDYTFTAGDGGQHTFPIGFTLKTAGNQTVAATDTATASITGSATASVNPAAADHLLFLQMPTDTAAGQTLSPVSVAVVDAFGNVEAGDNSDTVTLVLGSNPASGTLSGTLTVTVVNGVGTFSDLSIDLASDGYSLQASATGLTSADSDPFSITT